MSAASPKALGYRMPAEWERHEAIWLSWPHDERTFARLEVVENAYVRIVRAVHFSEEVRLLVLPGEKGRVERLLREGGVDCARLRLMEKEYADVWFRDYGPTFLSGPRGSAMAHWVFNAWGGKYPELLPDAALPVWMNEALGLPRFEPGIVLEGGSIDVDGAGLVMTTEQCLLNKNRNPDLSRARIEETLQDYLGAAEVLWLGEGIVGDDTDGHVDDIARFVAPRTVLCALEDDPADANFPMLRENYRRLLSHRCADGGALNVLKLPMPEPVSDARGRLPASYANFYIGNTVVLLPAFGGPRDAEAEEILRGLFPSRRVVPIPCRELVEGLGTLHCISQQQPG